MSEFNASTPVGRRTIHNAQLFLLMNQNGFPVSTGCCPSSLTSGDPRCWLQNKMGLEECCGSPVLPMRCLHATASAFVFDVDSDGDVTSLNLRHGVANPKDCASLDDAALYFSLPVIGGSDKGSSANSFMDFYEPLMHKFGDSARLMEIGVHFGNSLATWSFWFPRGQIIGVDVDPEAKLSPILIGRGANITGNVQIRILEAPSRQFFAAMMGVPPFDIVIDDGNHSFESQRNLFENLFPKLIAPGGIYIVEDTGPDSTRYFMDLAQYHSELSNGAKLHLLEDRDFAQLIDVDWRRAIQSIHFHGFAIAIAKRGGDF